MLVLVQQCTSANLSPGNKVEYKLVSAVAPRFGITPTMRSPFHRISWMIKSPKSYILAGLARTMSKSASQKVPLSALPLPSKSRILPLNLTPDPRTPSPSAFHQYQKETPSYQRRARLLSPEAHFSYVAPCPIQFPYRAIPEESEDATDEAAFIEKWLGEKEALFERPVVFLWVETVRAD